MRLFVTVMLGLSLTCDQCHGFENLNLRELCRNLPSSDDTTTNTAKNCPSMGSSAYGTFSCTVSIIGLEPTRPGYTLWFGLVWSELCTQAQDQLSILYSPYHRH